MSSRILRRDGGAAGLSLGALLAIALGGGLLLFTGIGMLMAWRVRVRQKRSSARVYTIPDAYSQTRLTKRPLLMTESAVSGISTRLSSRFSLAMPPVLPLPPMPSYRSLYFFRTPSRSKRPRSWIRGDDFHGPEVNKDAKEGWSSRDSWFGRKPTVPDLTVAEEGETVMHCEYLPEQKLRQQQHQQHPYQYHFEKTERQPLQQYTDQRYEPLNVQKRNSREVDAQGKHSTTSLASQQQDDIPRGRQSAIRTPAAAHVRPSVSNTEMGLRDILRSTDQRLRDGGSRSPQKTPQGSPTRDRGGSRSPAKTPRSYRSNTSYGTGLQSRGTSSPHKRGNMSQSTFAHSRDTTATSIGSAANSLLEEATQQLELTKGQQSPGQLRGREWEPRGDQILPPSRPGVHTPDHSPDRNAQRSPQRSPQRRRSYDSDQSSSLSTLYSEPEQEEQEHNARPQDPRYDPFVAVGARQGPAWQNQVHPAGARPLRRIRSLSPDKLTGNMNASPVHDPRLQHSANSKPSQGRGVDFKADPPPPLFLQPRNTEQSDEVRPKGQRTEELPGLPSAPSDSSFTSESVVSDDSQDTAMPTCETPKPEWVTSSHRDKSPSVSPMTPTKADRAANSADLSSSPYSEQEVLSMLLSNGAKGRALPQPPTTVTAPDGSIVPAGLSPRPSVRVVGGHPAMQRSISNSSSFYSNVDMQAPATASSGSPVRRLTNSRSGRQQQTLSMTIAELRRMNSVVSSYSAASIASTVPGDAGDSPTIPSIFSGNNVTQPRSNPKTAAMGTRHYFNIGKNTPRKHKPTKSTGNIQQPQSTAPRHARSNSEGRAKNDSSLKVSDKENQHGLGIKDAAPTQTEAPRARSKPAVKDTATVKPTSATRIPAIAPEGKAKRSPVKDLIAREMRTAEKRASVESLGYYDKDGFLLPSPEREARLQARKKGIRM